ncbi:hypothetical protein NXY11_02645 [Parabacteroides faecis]|uniref:hypothetical protein n=1 Tax=Parabacteroides faecis TaxID=1217282 RepID=UPI002164AEBA|nr:hypothetical protein [Parabacteroides faecis]MCS2894248.1 hypothetical protein [Parabacteroides faecis]UVQ47166.1 hypothetical protein NXY11_02645 [Parabacteroides faecis]
MTILLSSIIAVLLIYIMYVRKKTNREIDEFAESILYKDFSRKYPRFQTITDAFLNLAKARKKRSNII